MAQRHMDRLSAVDTAFLEQEGDATHMHIGGIAIFAGPPPGIDAVMEHIRSRLHLVPRYRQKLARPPLQSGRPVWIDDPHFNLAYHVRHTALPAPGDEERLRGLASRLFAQRLDRTKPLWEIWVVEGLDGGRFALISKTHHALVDGISGVDLVTALFDLTPEVRDEPPGEEWVPRPEPSQAQLLASAARGAVDRTLEVAGDTAGAVTSPQRALGAVRSAIEGVGEVAWTGLNAPPPTPFNVPIGPHRRLVTVQASLADYKSIKNALGGTVNDVVLAVVAGGLRRFLGARGAPVDELELRACVPVSVRTEAQRGTLGNRLTQILAPLPVYVEDPVERLEVVRAAMDGLKESKQALGAETIAGMQGFAPPTILAQASRLNFSNRFYNLLVTNIPGPQIPIYLLGRKLESLYPIPFLAGERALAIAIMSYDGALDYGLLGDLDALPDLDLLADGIEASADELLRAARRPAAKA